MTPISFTLLVGPHKAYDIRMHDTSTLKELQQVVIDNFPDADERTVKLIFQGKRLNVAHDGDLMLKHVGIRHGSKLKLMYSTRRHVNELNRDGWERFDGGGSARVGEEGRGRDDGQEHSSGRHHGAHQRKQSHKLKSFPVSSADEDKECTEVKKKEETDVKKKEETDVKKKEDTEMQKGDKVLYKTRDGNWVPVTIDSVDYTIVPPSYGIQVMGDDGEMRVRETEASRLKKIHDHE